MVLTENIRNLMDPVNDFLFKNLYLLAIIIAIVVLIMLLSKLKDSLIFRKHKNDIHSTTNTWWSWEEFKNEKNKE